MTRKIRGTVIPGSTLREIGLSGSGKEQSKNSDNITARAINRSGFRGVRRI